ncbi:MAG: hypothetical protein WCI04_03730 [archaeon]
MDSLNPAFKRCQKVPMCSSEDVKNINAEAANRKLMAAQKSSAIVKPIGFFTRMKLRLGRRK